MKVKTPPVVTASSPASLNKALARTGDLQKQLAEAQSDWDKETALVTEVHQPRVAAITKALETQLEAVRAYVAENRDELLAGQKSVDLKGGTIAVRLTPASCQIEDEADLLRRLLKGKREEFLNRKVTIDKRALLSARPRFKGVAYVQGERLDVTPATSAQKTSVNLQPQDS